MPNNLIISNASKTAAMNAVTALLNAGGPGTANIYSGAQPAGPDTGITSQTLLASLTFSATAFAAASNGVSTANAITAGTAIATGTATWARLQSGAWTPIIDCSVGTSASDIILGSTSITGGNTVSLTSFTLTHP
jgi:hypothetical protein